MLKKLRQMGLSVLPQRGFDAWVAMKGRRIESLYLKSVLATDKTAPATSGSILKSRPRRILFVADLLWEQESLIPELEKVCDVTVLNLAEGLLSQEEGALSDRVFGCVEQFADTSRSYTPDLILLYARPQMLSVDLFELIRHHWPSSPLLGMNLDDKTEFLDYSSVGHNFYGNYKEWARHFDLNLCSNRGALDLYASEGLPVYYFPEGCAHNAFGPVKRIEDYRHLLTFAGAVKAERRDIIEYLQKTGIAVETFGRGWPGSEWVDDLDALFRSSQINLGIGSAAPAYNLSHLKGRDIECPAAGGCYITSYNWDLTELFEINKEILCYRNNQELVEMLAYYLKRPDECLKVATAGYERCMAEHTWETRFRKLFADTGMFK